MKTLMTIGLVLMMSLSVFAQVPLPIFRGAGNAVVDSAGNLVVFDAEQSSTGVTVTGLRRSFFAPQTRITIQSPGTTGNVQTVTYDAGIQVIGVGSSAIFAIATVYTVSGTTLTTTQSLIAIKAGQQLPAALSGFPSSALSSPVQAKLGPSDYISLISETAPAGGSLTSTIAITRTAKVVHFNGTSFDVASSGTLP
jgi:hypothetical protein